MNKNIIIGLGIALILIGGIVSWKMHEKQAAAPAVTGQYAVTLTENGFEPAEIRIAQGQTVTFRTTAGKPFWPASNPHPAHTDYPEFDAQLPIAPDAGWNFTFGKAGTWRYHDHLAPYFTGTIVVTPAS